VARPADRQPDTEAPRHARPPSHVWVNGRLGAAAEPVVSAFDHGFLLGDGVFETLRAMGGRILELDEHLGRLRASASGLDIAIPEERLAQLEGAMRELLAAEALDGPGSSASVRVTVSRGTMIARGLLPLEKASPTVVIQAWPVAPPPPGHLEDGISLIASAVRRDPGNPLAALKTTSRADFVYARIEARRAGADDALLLTTDGHLAEATTANIFLLQGVELATPSLDCGILAGTTREWILRWAGRVGLRAREGRLLPDALAAADEAFVCSSVAGVLPVTRFEGRPIGTGRPGPWTLRARSDREGYARGQG
jgi:branched-chain amino acid aminotransferase